VGERLQALTPLADSAPAGLPRSCGTSTRVRARIRPCHLPETNRALHHSVGPVDSLGTRAGHLVHRGRLAAHPAGRGDRRRDLPACHRPPRPLAAMKNLPFVPSRSAWAALLAAGLLVACAAAVTTSKAM